MDQISISNLKIKGFKSLYSIELKNVDSFSVYVGPNGSGKSNFLDALEFVSHVVRSGINEAINSQGGYEFFRPAQNISFAPKFLFSINCVISGKTFKYSIEIEGMDGLSGGIGISELLRINNKEVLSRNWGEQPIVNDTAIQLDPGYSALILFEDLPLKDLLAGITIYRIQPIYASQPNKSSEISNQLNSSGNNLASVLRKLETSKASKSVKEELLDYMQLIVPGLERISTRVKSLTNNTGFSFKEEGTANYFPANMVSDGTIYFLCMLVALLDNPSKIKWLLFDEPEQGLHPKAIKEIISLMRGISEEKKLVWAATHSESIIRNIELNELVVIEKKKGKTKIESASQGRLTIEDLEPMGLNEAWLANLFGGNP